MFLGFGSFIEYGSSFGLAMTTIWFEDHKHPEYVYKLKKALYGLKQAPRQWYERLSLFLLSHEYERGKVDKTLFILELISS